LENSAEEAGGGVNKDKVKRMMGEGKRKKGKEKNDTGRMKTPSILKMNIQLTAGEVALECERKFDFISSNLC